MISRIYNKNYSYLPNKLIECLKINIDNILKELEDNVYCVGSGASYSTAYLFSKILNEYYNKNSISLSPRELLNEKIKTNHSILIFSYSGTSKDTEYLRKKYPEAIIFSGRNIEEFKDKNNIISYYTNNQYEKGLILYENILVPITLLLNNINKFKNIIKYEIDNVNNKSNYLGNIKINNVAVFSGDYCQAATLDLKEKLMETARCSFDIYEKKFFSHGQYNYYFSKNYDVVIYFKQKSVSEYEARLIEFLKKNSIKLIVIESEYDKIEAEYDLLFKNMKLCNELFNLFPDDLSIVNKLDAIKYLYEYEGDFS